jgi:hypothetical protein
MKMFDYWSAQNPVINLRTGQTQFSPLSFGSNLVTSEGLPVIEPVLLYPNSPYAVPAMMNWRG